MHRFKKNLRCAANTLGMRPARARPSRRAQRLVSRLVSHHRFGLKTDAFFYLTELSLLLAQLLLPLFTITTIPTIIIINPFRNLAQ